MAKTKRPKPESTGLCAGFKWIVLLNHMGFRCGYVNIPSKHPWHGKSYEELDAKVHGGLTFAEQVKDSFLPDGYWIGFDCGHCGDAPDLKAMGPEVEENHKIAATMVGAFFGNIGERFGNKKSIVRSKFYVEKECKNLCGQAKDVADENRKSRTTSKTQR